jgi:hypothetical protein
MASPLMAPPYLGLSSTNEVEAHGEGVTLRGADPHLRGVVEVTGYRVHALDGEIGHIENFMIDDADWSVHYLIVDTRNWWFGKHVLISPVAVKSVDWFDRHVEPDVPGEQVRASPPWDPSWGTAYFGPNAIVTSPAGPPIFAESRGASGGRHSGPFR